MRKYLSNNQAFSFAELLVTVAILAIVIGVMQSSMVSGNFSWTSYQGTIGAQGQARQALFAMARELRQASDIVVAQDGSSVDFTRSGIGNISYDWSAIGADANRIIRTDSTTTRTLAKNISALSFVANETTITIDVTASASVAGGRTSTAQFKERIALR